MTKKAALEMMQINGCIEQETLETLSYYLDRFDYICEESVGTDGDEQKMMLAHFLDDALKGKTRSARGLRAMAKHYLALIRYIYQYTTAREQLSELLTEAMKLPIAETNED